MKYQVSRDGANLGEFSLDELREGRVTGQFDGWEFVWRESAAEWQAIDKFLKIELQRPRITPPPIPLTAEQKRNRIILLVLCIVGVLFVAGLVTAGMSVVKAVRRVRQLSGTDSRTEALAAARKPVVVNTNTATAENWRERRREFRARQWIKGYQQNADHATACDAESLEYLEAWLDANYGTGRRTNRFSLREWGDRLAGNAGCDDPLVLTLAGVEAVETKQAIERLERALKNFPGSRHKAYAHFYAAVSLADKLEQQPERLAALDTLAIAQLRACFTDSSFQPGDAGEVADILINGWGKAFFQRNPTVVPAVAAAAKDPAWEWLSLVLAGEHHIREAWRARGGGYADKVTVEGWRKFSSELEEARRCLTRAWNLHPNLPMAPARMVYVALGSSDITEMRVWFDRAVAAQFDYPGAWADMRWGLRPRWHGGWDSMREFGITALNTGRFDTDVPRMLFDSISDLESEMTMSPRQHLYGRPDLWPHLQRMYEGYIASPSQASRRKGWRTSYAIVAHLAGKPEVAHGQLEALDWQPQTTNLEGWHTDLSLMSLEVAARSGPLAREVSKAESLRQSEAWRQALNAYRALAGDARADARTREFVQHRTAILEMEERLHRGEWVDFLPCQNNDPAWHLQTGSYRRLADGSVELTPGERGHMLVCRAWVGTEFEVRGEFEPANSATGQFQAGLVMGLPTMANYDWLAFLLKHGRGESHLASYSRGWTSRQRQQSIKLTETRNTFEFRFEDGQVQSTVNGQPVHKKASPPASVNYSPDEFLVGLGAYEGANDAVIRYRNVQLRLLPGTNAPPRK
jgi:hypothetical protein